MTDHDGRGWPEESAKTVARLRAERDYWKNVAALWKREWEQALGRPIEADEEEA